MKSEVPKPASSENIFEKTVLGPIEKMATNWLMKWMNRIFGVRAIRSYLVIFLLGYFGDKISIDKVNQTYKLEIADNSFYSIVVTLIACIAILSLLDQRETKSTQKSIERERAWSNFIREIQPFIDKPIERVQTMFTILYGDTIEGSKDFFAKQMKEMKNLKEKIDSFENRFDPIDELVLEIQKRKKK
jgi:hypothetical protein